MSNESKIAPMQEQLTYANILLWGGWLGLAMMTVSYLLYLSGAITPHVEIATVVNSWGMGVDDFLHATGAPTGWTWLGLIGKGDYMNFIGLALLAVLTIVCYLVILRGYIRKNDKLYATICILEVLVLSLAASGLLGSGGH